MRRLVVLLAVALSLVAGCSLQGLDRFDWPNCGQCEVLNDRDGIAEGACELWRCDPQTQECVFSFRDDDGDGHAPLRCGGSDCDDQVASAYEGATEICNGIDDDCNGWIDDLAADAAPPDGVLGAPHTPRWLSATPVEGGLLTAYQTAGGAGLELVSDATADLSAGAPLALVTSQPGSDVDASGCMNKVLMPGAPSRFEACSEALPECPHPQRCYESRGGERFCDNPRMAVDPDDVCNSDAQCDDGSFCNGQETCRPGAGDADANGCRRGTPPCSYGCLEAERTCEDVARDSACAIGDAAIVGAGDGDYLAAVVAPTNGCGAGVLRLGYFAESPRAPDTRYPVRRIAQRGDPKGLRSTSWLGVDGVHAMLRCPGPDSGRAPGAPLGVTGPVIAALPIRDSGRLRPQGLVAYLAGPMCRALGTCPTSGPGRFEGDEGPLDVEVIGVWLEEGSLGTSRVGWVNASDDGEPVRLGTRTAAETRRPAVSAWVSGDEAGYFVAYPKESGGIAVHVVPAMADPAPECPRLRSCTSSGECEANEVCTGSRCQPAVPECTSAADCEPAGICDGGRCAPRPCIARVEPRNTVISETSVERRETPRLDVPAAIARFPGERIVGDVVMAVGRTRESGVVELAFAWRLGDAVKVALATFDPADDTLHEGRIERFAASAPRDLAITHVSEGMIREGAELDGEPVDAGDRGGFVVVWTDDTSPTMPGGEETRAARIADYDGSLVAPGAVVIGGRSVQPRAWVDGTGVLRVLAHHEDGFAVIPAVCGQRAR